MKRLEEMVHKNNVLCPGCCVFFCYSILHGNHRYAVHDTVSFSHQSLRQRLHFQFWEENKLQVCSLQLPRF